MNNQKLNEAALLQDCLKRLGDEKSVLHRAAHVLELVAHSSVGLGEVLQDYAHQASGQLRDILRVIQTPATMSLPEDMEIIHNIHLVIKSTRAALDMTPTAMLRNKADTLGEEKLSRAAVAQVADDFKNSTDIAQFLASENAGHALARFLMANADAGIIVSEHSRIHTPMTQHY